MSKQNHYDLLVGVDESGRGPLAGPVFACALVVFNRDWDDFDFPIKDAKQFSEKSKEQIYEALKNDSEVEWALGRVGNKVIDRMNIFQASKLAMRRAVNHLQLKLKKQESSIFLLVDGITRIDLPHKQQTIIKGDEKVALISLASIVAKVNRDRAMKRYHCKFPEYGFAQHKGYATAHHRAMLKKYGPCPIHRLSFKPVKECRRSN